MQVRGGRLCDYSTNEKRQLDFEALSTRFSSIHLPRKRRQLALSNLAKKSPQRKDRVGSILKYIRKLVHEPRKIQNRFNWGGKTLCDESATLCRAEVDWLYYNRCELSAYENFNS
jgi:hypothetical protein